MQTMIVTRMAPKKVKKIEQWLEIIEIIVLHILLELEAGVTSLA